MTNTTNTETKSHKPDRTKVLTIVAIVAVALASLFAIGANLGILDRSDENDNLGLVPASGEFIPEQSRVDLYVDESGVISTTPPESTLDAASVPVNWDVYGDGDHDDDRDDDKDHDDKDHEEHDHEGGESDD